jgi:hypothetical protein
MAFHGSMRRRKLSAVTATPAAIRYIVWRLGPVKILAMRTAWLSVIGIVLWSAIVLGSTCAQAQVYHGNDTGGIISWSCENEAMAQQIAAEYCARWDKYHRITSVHRQYGDFIGFNCLWSPHVNRYALPAVRTRNTCYYERPRPVLKAYK